MYHDPISRQQAPSSSPSIHTPAIQRQPDPAKITVIPSSSHILQLSAQLGNQQVGKWLAKQGTLQAKPVIQRTVTLNDETVSSIEEAINLALDTMLEADQAGSVQYGRLYNLYNDFGSGSLTMQTIAGIRALTHNSPNAILQALDQSMEGLIVGNVRSSNYPSSYSAGARQALATYTATHQNPANANECLCPNCNRFVDKTDMTIDHITPVATHWNTIGRDTDRTTRTTWYSDITNHRYMCGSCNSRIGSGGVRYNLTTGPNYS